MIKIFFLLAITILVFSCNQNTGNETAGSMPVSEYFNYGDSGVQVAGIKMIPIKTPVGEFKVWTKRFGNNPRIKVLLLHGGPAATAEYMECFQSFFSLFSEEASDGKSSTQMLVKECLNFACLFGVVLFAFKAKVLV